MPRERQCDGRIYSPSTSEILLEEICASFGTELREAHIDDHGGLGSTRLWRLSKPALIESPNNRQRVLQFQYTRFTPLHSGKALEIYNQNRKLRKHKPIEDLAKFYLDLQKNQKKWDSFIEMTDNSYIWNLGVHKWEKALYFAIYSVRRDDLGTELARFAVHEPFSLPGFKYSPEKGETSFRDLPEVYIKFSISPYFVIGQGRERTGEIFDNITISFPRLKAEHKACEEASLNAHLLGELNPLIGPDAHFVKGSNTFEVEYKMHSLVPREATMAFIQSYIKKRCLNKVL